MQTRAQPFNTFRLIVNIILDIVLNQLRQNIDVVVQHFHILIVTSALIHIVAYVIYPLLQRIDIP